MHKFQVIIFPLAVAAPRRKSWMRFRFKERRHEGFQIPSHRPVIQPYVNRSLSHLSARIPSPYPSLSLWLCGCGPSALLPLCPRIVDPFAKTVPDHVDSVLSYGVEDATVCCFDKRGTYLAVGYATGILVIWDFVTRQDKSRGSSTGHAACVFAVSEVTCA